jgi:hypothetical protein
MINSLKKRRIGALLLAAREAMETKYDEHDYQFLDALYRMNKYKLTVFFRFFLLPLGAEIS